ncbi:MAG: hypothetical protein P8X90_07505, partial [Desulfobacterales bacterium]
YKFVWERFATAIKIDRIPLFDVGSWTFDVRRSLVSFYRSDWLPFSQRPPLITNNKHHHPA